MNSIAQIQAAKNSELVAFWNANCESVGKPAVKKFSSNEAAVKRCSDLFNELEAKRAAEVEAAPVAEVEAAPVAEVEAAPVVEVETKVERSKDHIVTVIDKVVSTTVETKVEKTTEHFEEGEEEEEEGEEEAPKNAAPFNPLTSIMNAINGTLKVPASMESLPATRHELSDELAENKSAPAPKRRASNSEGVAASWADGDVRTARLTRNGVRVTIDGATSEFKSVNEAFRHFRLPTSKHIRFRGLLKSSATKTLAFEHESKSYLFEVI